MEELKRDIGDLKKECQHFKRILTKSLKEQLVDSKRHTKTIELLEIMQAEISKFVAVNEALLEQIKDEAEKVYKIKMAKIKMNTKIIIAVITTIGTIVVAYLAIFK
jgi:hypothetical protein